MLPSGSEFDDVRQTIRSQREVRRNIRQQRSQEHADWLAQSQRDREEQRAQMNRDRAQRLAQMIRESRDRRQRIQNGEPVTPLERPPDPEFPSDPEFDDVRDFFRQTREDGARLHERAAGITRRRVERMAQLQRNLDESRQGVERANAGNSNSTQDRADPSQVVNELRQRLEGATRGVADHVAEMRRTRRRSERRLRAQRRRLEQEREESQERQERAESEASNDARSMPDLESFMQSDVEARLQGATREVADHVAQMRRTRLENDCRLAAQRRRLDQAREERQERNNRTSATQDLDSVVRQYGLEVGSGRRQSASELRSTLSSLDAESSSLDSSTTLSGIEASRERFEHKMQCLDNKMRELKKTCISLLFPIGVAIFGKAAGVDKELLWIIFVILMIYPLYRYVCLLGDVLRDVFRKCPTFIKFASVWLFLLACAYLFTDVEPVPLLLAFPFGICCYFVYKL